MSFKEANSLTDAEIAEVMDFADTVSGWVKSVRAEAFKRAMANPGSIPGWKLGESKSNREFFNPDTIPQAISAIDPSIPYDDLFERSMRSPAQIENVLKTLFPGKKGAKIWREKFNALIKDKPSASTSLVRETDARPAVKRGREFSKYVTKDKLDIEDLL